MKFSKNTKREKNKQKKTSDQEKLQIQYMYQQVKNPRYHILHYFGFRKLCKFHSIYFPNHISNQLMLLYKYIN